jgi:hypothetical protein
MGVSSLVPVLEQCLDFAITLVLGFSKISNSNKHQFWVLQNISKHAEFGLGFL